MAVLFYAWNRTVWYKRVSFDDLKLLPLYGHYAGQPALAGT